MRKDKVGTIFLVSILALAGVGISYAGFSDSIFIFGNVSSATVELEIVPWYSGTWVWKVWGFDDYIPGYPQWFGLDIIWDPVGEILVCSGFTQFKPTNAMIDAWIGPSNAHYQLISYSEAGPGTVHDTFDADVDFEYNNLFPCIDFSADFIVHYIGSIPARINPDIIIQTAYPEGDDGWLELLWDYDNPAHPDWGINIKAYRAIPIIGAAADEIVGFTVTDEVIFPGFQLHYCDYVYVEVTIHLPQDNFWQGLYGEFFTEIEVIQWNDFCEQEPMVEVDQFDFPIDLIGIIIPDGTYADIGVSGSATMHVFFEGPVEGIAFDDNGNGLDEVDTELVELELTGTDPLLGNVILTLNSVNPTIGEFEEQMNYIPGLLDIEPFNSVGACDSFFDVFFEIEFTDSGKTYYNRDPLRIVSSITYKPPNPSDFYSSTGIVELYDEFGRPTGLYLEVP